MQKNSLLAERSGARSRPSQATRRAAVGMLMSAALMLTGCGDDEPEDDAAPPASQEPSGQSEGRFAVNTRELFLSCSGEGEPTMVLEVGEGASSDAMDAVRDAYDSTMRVCSYDRANKGQSGPAPTPRLAEDLVSDLDGLLDAAEVPGPHLLVGASAGGMLVQAFAAINPDDVAGVVALNPVPPWQEWSTRAFGEMSAEEQQGETEYFSGGNGESLHYKSLSELIAQSPAPADVPLHVVQSTVAECESPDDVCGRTHAVSEQIMKELAEKWPQGRYTAVEAQHDVHDDDIDAVKAAVDDVLARSRRG